MLRDWQAFGDLAKRFAEGDVCLRVAGLASAARALAVAELLHAPPRPVVIVVASLADAHRFAQDLKFFGAPAFEFPEREPQLWKGGHHREAEAERAMIVRRLTAGEPIAVVVTPAALDTPLPAPTDFREGTLRLATNDSLDRELLLEALEKAGYERVDTVVEVGQWSARGGIVDVFSPMHPSPARLELEVLAAEDADVTLEALSVDPYSGKFERLVADLERWRGEGFSVRLVAADAGQAEHLREILHDHGLDTRVAEGLESPDAIAIVVGELSGGFAIPDVGLVVLAVSGILGAPR